MTLHSSHWPVLFPDHLSQHRTRRGGRLASYHGVLWFLGFSLTSCPSHCSPARQHMCTVEEREGEGGGEEEEQNACESNKYGCMIAEDIVIGLHH